MATNKERKEETRKRMAEAASRGFREHGFAGIGVDGIAKEAGATSGAFYAHFGSKDGAFAVALQMGLDEVIEAVPRFQREKGPLWAKAFADYYMGSAHRTDLACGCAMATLAPEVVKATPEAHGIYQQKMLEIVGLMAKGLAGGTTKQRAARAWSFISVLTGGLTAARSVKTEVLAKEISSAVRSTALSVAGETRLV